MYVCTGDNTLAKAHVLYSRTIICVQCLALKENLKDCSFLNCYVIVNTHEDQHRVSFSKHTIVRNKCVNCHS